MEGAQYADVYKSRSTLDFEPTPPKEPIPTRHRHITQDDVAPEDKELLADAEKTGEIHKSQSTHDVGEMGSVLLERGKGLKEKSVQTITETAVVEHRQSSADIDAVDDTERSVAEQGGIYESKSTYETGKPIEGLGEYLTGAAVTGGVAFLRGAKSVVDPFAWARGAHDITYLASSPDAQRRLAEHIARDPFSFSIDVGASIAGGYYGGKFISGLYRGAKEAELREFLDEYPEEAFYAEDGIPDPQIPHPTDVERVTVKSVDEVRVVDDLGEGFLKSHQVSAGGSWPKSGTKGFGYRRTGEGLIQEFVPEGMGYTEIHTRFWLEYGQTHLPGVTGLPPYFEAALGISPLVGVVPEAGALSGLISGVPSLDDPVPNSKPDVLQESKPTLEDAGVDEKPRIIEMVDETYKPKPKPTPPKVITKPDPIIKPVTEPPINIPDVIPDIIEDIDTPTTIPPITIQKTVQEPKPEPLPLGTPAPFIPDYRPRSPRPPKMPPLTSRKKRRVKKKGAKDPLGFEFKEYKVPSIEAMKGKSSKPRGKKRRLIPL